MDAHPLESPDVRYKEPDETALFQFDFTDSQQLASTETIASLLSTTITPTETHHGLRFNSITNGPLFAGETLTAPDGDVATAFEGTSSTSAKVELLVASGVQLGSGEELTGSDSGAVVEIAESNNVGTLLAESPNVMSSTIDGKVLQIQIRNGVRPMAGAPWREYVVRCLIRTTLSQELVAIGRLRIPEAAEADNAR